MGLFKKDTVDDILSVFIAILISYSIPRLPFVGPYFEKYPILIFIFALLLLAYKKKIETFLGGK